ncbi:hypothetical protein IFM89_026075 [Coptis chinensis]|uniref:Methyltransferase n=1 Tax=Coptis chinensis TaxID=261450 RepID=A0A835HF67_9MAGN|nr:hypothetical protein IFM89_026075 [Coptis chinensis]
MKQSSSMLTRICAFILIFFTFLLYLVKHYTDGYLSFFQNPQSSQYTTLHNNNNNLSSILLPSLAPSPSPSALHTDHTNPLLFDPLPPPVQRTRGVIKLFGVVDDNGIMMDDFEVGEFDPHFVEEISTEELNKERSTRIRVRKFSMCPMTMADYIPCLDNVKERHCPKGGEKLNCLVPAPKGYRPPIPWPKSRSEVWFANVPHTRLVDDKRGQNLITRDKNKFRFPRGVEKYVNQISKMVPGIQFGVHTRVVLDIGCGVASFGAFLLSRNVTTLSIAPQVDQENQVQFALERGLPAMVATFTTRRLLYPSQAFDLIHCSRCMIDWIRDGGILLLEVNRMLRGGGYFAWATQPVHKHEKALQEQWKEMEDLAGRLCWELVAKEGYVDLKLCINHLPENGYGANISPWPLRIYNPPDRLQSIQMDAYKSKKELFKAEYKYWLDVLARYIRAFHWKKLKIRNVMDMRAGFGGFAAALVDLQIDCWVMNVVPVSGPNTLPVIFDRGFIGVMHDWCEPFDTYPRTYDLVHAAGLFTIERTKVSYYCFWRKFIDILFTPHHFRCKISSIMLEMDRILRPGGHAYIRDSLYIMDELQEIATAMGWQTRLRDTAEGPHASYRDLICEKRLLHT